MTKLFSTGPGEWQYGDWVFGEEDVDLEYAIGGAEAWTAWRDFVINKTKERLAELDGE